MIRLYQAGTLFDAQLLSDQLKERGIKCHIMNSNAHGAMGEIPFIEVYPEIWIEDAADLVAAKQLVAEFEAREVSSKTVECPRCGETNPTNFSLCWSCEAPLND